MIYHINFAYQSIIFLGVLAYPSICTNPFSYVLWFDFIYAFINTIFFIWVEWSLYNFAIGKCEHTILLKHKEEVDGLLLCGFFINDKKKFIRKPVEFDKKGKVIQQKVSAVKRTWIEVAVIQNIYYLLMISISLGMRKIPEVSVFCNLAISLKLALYCTDTKKFRTKLLMLTFIFHKWVFVVIQLFVIAFYFNEHGYNYGDALVRYQNILAFIIVVMPLIEIFLFLINLILIYYENKRDKESEIRQLE